MSRIRAALRRGLSENSGQATIEFAGTVWILVAAVLIAWQLALVGWSANAAANAARTAARAYSRTGDAGQSAADGVQSLSSDGFNPGAVHVSFSGSEAAVSLKMPLIVPWIQIPVNLTAHATMPHTG